MNKIFNIILNTVRKNTPLWLHWKIGPYIAYVVYWFRMYILRNKDAPKILSVIDTLDLIIKNNLSVIRFGDGEMSIMQKSDLGFQKTSHDLAARLRDILKKNLPNLLICIPGLFGKLEDFAGDAYWFALHHQLRYRNEWLEMLSTSQIYGDTLITRPYLAYKNSVRKESGEVFRKIFSIWNGKHVVLIEGAKSRLGVGNDMFKHAASISRILGPAENAYAKIDEIRQQAMKVNKDNLILLALGPAAKVLAYDLFLAGYRVIDIGHVDMEYEMFIRQEPIETKVRYKYFNEINERDPEECTDPEYIKQIIAKI